MYIGRVDNDVTIDDLKDYILEVSGITVTAVNVLKIRTEEHKAFKVTVKLSEREKLFSPELWPEEMIVDKYFDRSKRYRPNRIDSI